MTYDLVVIGAGWAGLNAAKRAKELGLKVALIEKQDIGGTCLNRGCIPTKALIQSAKIYTLLKKAKAFGVEVLEPKINFSEIQSQKNKIIEQLRQGINFLLKDIDIFNAPSEILSAHLVKAGDKQLETKYILIASGSKPYELKALEFDGRKIISSNEILNLKEIPASLLIVGAGVIGCEFASLFAALGTQVSLVEKMPQLLPGIDKEVARRLESIFRKKGIKVNTNSDAAAMDLKDYPLVLVSIGRVTDIEGLGLDKIGLKLENGKILVDDYLKTNIPNIYAAGDCTGKFMLAHFAAYQGVVAAENIAGLTNPQRADNSVIPNCIFTQPEIASVGLSEEEARAKGLEVKVNKFDFLGSAMARILAETEGFIKIISEQKTEEILGAAIIGPRATELIASLSLAISSRLKLSQVRNTIFAHPTLSEAISEAVKYPDAGF